MPLGRYAHRPYAAPESGPPLLSLGSKWNNSKNDSHDGEQWLTAYDIVRCPCLLGRFFTALPIWDLFSFTYIWLSEWNGFEVAHHIPSLPPTKDFFRYLKMSQAIFVVFSALATVLLLLPLPWHIKSGNAGTLLYIFWTLTANLILFINAIVWKDNVGNWAPVWCDITGKLFASYPVALPLASLCINRRLANIALSKNRTFSDREKRRQLAIDLLLGLGGPAIYMLMQYIVQAHRFNILENYGCVTPFWTSVPSVLLMLVWPIIISLISAIYGAIAARALLMQRIRFNALLRGSQTGLSTSRFVRLMLLACSDILIAIPLASYFLAGVIPYLQPWTSWSDVHADWGTVVTVTTQQLAANPAAAENDFLQRWIPVIAALLFFAFFGFSEDSVAGYMVAWRTTCRVFPKRSTDDEDGFNENVIPTLGTYAKRSSYETDHDPRGTTESKVTHDVNGTIAAADQKHRSDLVVAVVRETSIV